MNGQDERDEDMLSVEESLDSDEVRNRDGDAVVTPPEDWTAADRFGTTAREQREGEPLGQRLAQERPDVGADELRPGDARSQIEGVDSVRSDTRGRDASPTHRHAGQVDGTPEDGDSFYSVDE